MEQKNKGVIIIIILTIIVLSISFFILKNRNVQNNFPSNNNFVSKGSSEEKNQEISSESEDIIPEQETVGSTTGGGGGSIIGIIKDLIGLCSEDQIIYSMINFNKTSTCNINQGNICLDKTVTCSMEIKNRDSEVSGSFKLQLIFSEAENQSNLLKITESNFFLSPGESSEFLDSLNIQSTGEDGIANKEINCFFNTIEVPKKEVC